MSIQMKSLKKRMAKVMLCGTLLASSMAVPTEVQAKASIGSVEMYKMENVKEDGTGDYLLEIKLIDGWKPYSIIEIGVVAGALCTAFDNGYSDLSGKNNYILEGVKGAILEVRNNGGTVFLGKVTNPTNGVIEVPINLCEEHERGILAKQSTLYLFVKGNSTYYADGHATFKDAKPISERKTTTQTPSTDKVYKEDVSFTIGKETFTITNKYGQKITKDMAKGEAPYMSNGRTLIPVRYAGEALNASVEWNPAKREVIVKKNDVTVRLPLNSQYAIYNDGTKVDMGAKTTQVNGRTFVPVGALGRMLDATVTWDEATQTVIFVNEIK